MQIDLNFTKGNFPWGPNYRAEISVDGRVDKHIISQKNYISPKMFCNIVVWQLSHVYCLHEHTYLVSNGDFVKLSVCEVNKRYLLTEKLVNKAVWWSESVHSSILGLCILHVLSIHRSNG